MYTEYKETRGGIYIEIFGIILAFVLLLAIVFSKVAHRFGVPSLLLFLFLGMLFGSDGLFKIPFNDYQIAEWLCSIGLMLIIFYGGFGTSWKSAKKVVFPSILMSTVGTIITALVTGIFCFYVLRIPFWEGMLVGCVLASTDAASVFSILRTSQINFKNGLASLLEMESGSNDPFAYLLTIICIQMLTLDGGSVSIPFLLIKQILFGIGIGLIFAYFSIYILKNIELDIDGLYPIFTLSVVILAFYTSSLIEGNGFLSVYLIGIIVGNSHFPHKKFTIHFFDGVSWLMQILLFFMLGLLSFPSNFPKVFMEGLFIALCLTFIARPLASFILLTPCRIPLRQQMLINFAGLRGAASIAFSIMAVGRLSYLQNDLFHIVFLVSMFSVTLQGSLLPYVAKKLDLISREESIFKTFNDYEEGHLTQLYEIVIDQDHEWRNKKIKDASIPRDILIVGIKRQQRMIIPKGNVTLKENDCVIFSKDVTSS